MYPNLNAEMARTNVENADLQKLLKLTERTVRSRLNGSTDFWWQEIVLIRNTYFPHLSIDYLMSIDEKKAG